MRKARAKREASRRKYGVVSRCKRCGRTVVWHHAVVCQCAAKGAKRAK